MAAVSKVRVLDAIPVALIATLIVLALALSLDQLEPNRVMALLMVVASVTGLIVLARVKRQEWAEKISVVIASSTLLFVAIFVRPLDILSLYALFAVIMVTSQASGLGEMLRPIGGMPMAKDQALEVNSVLTATFARLGIVLAASLILSILIWGAFGLLNLGLTSDFTAFLLALIAIIILAVLSSLPE